MTRKTKNTRGRAADEDKETSAATEKSAQEGPASKSTPGPAETAETDQGAKAPSRAAASAPDPEGQAEDQGAQTSAAAETPAQEPEAAKAPAKAGEVEAGSPAPGSEKEAAESPDDDWPMGMSFRGVPGAPYLSEATLERLKNEVAATELRPLALPLTSGLEVVVVGPKRGRWRAGRHFGAEPVRIPLEELTEDDKDALIADPVLIVSVPEVSRRP